MDDFTERIDLLSERLGGAALLASDEFFAPKDNIVRASDPVFRPGEYTDRGKWMDGWESRRKRSSGHDWCILRLGLAGIVRGVVVDTAHFRGNFPESCSLDACFLPGHLDPATLTSAEAPWTEVLPRTELRGDAKNAFRIESPWRFNHVRLNIYPDGGVARLRVHGEPAADWKRVASAGGELDLAALEHGGAVEATSDRFFGSAHNLLLAGPSTHMGDGWETRRRRGPGHDWALLRLGLRGKVRRAEVDTAHFKGNFPESCSIEACLAPGASVEELLGPSMDWRVLLPRQKLLASTRHVFEDELAVIPDASHARFNIVPDGGVARLRLFGAPSAAGRAAVGLQWLNTLPPPAAEAELVACCGSSAWARAMAHARPVATADALYAAADRIWSGLEASDWMEAFRSHPRIGEQRAERSGPKAAQRWSEEEQSGVNAAGAGTLAALAEANRAYQGKFGFLFIVCARGKSADEMLALCRARLANPPDTELQTAAEEQRKITRARLAQLVGAD